jgi:hypothetical protein
MKAVMFSFMGMQGQCFFLGLRTEVLTEAVFRSPYSLFLFRVFRPLCVLVSLSLTVAYFMRRVQMY